MTTIPKPFDGTPEEASANFDSHSFGGDPGDERCYRCDCRPSHTAASYPCGAEVPRIDVPYIDPARVTPTGPGHVTGVQPEEEIR